MVASKKRSLAKTISWRVIATTDTFILAWLFTSDEVIAVINCRFRGGDQVGTLLCA